MKNAPPDLYADYLLDTLSEPDRTKVATEMAASPESAHELTLTRQALALWAEDRVTEATPSADLRRRLLQTVAGEDRFARFARLAPYVALFRRIFDLPAQAAADLLAKADGLTDWLEAAPGVRYSTSCRERPSGSSRPASSGSDPVPPSPVTGTAVPR